MQTLNQKMKPIASVVGTAFVATLASACSSDTATDTSVAATELAEGYDVTAKAETEGKCGEGKCGEGDHAAKNGEGKCGEGKCGEHDSKDAEGKCGEGKCGEGKCGEGKCGEGKCGG